MGEMAALLEVIEKFNAEPGIKASFKRAGTAELTKDQLLEAVSWPDKTGGFTHCLSVVCDNADALKGYLVSDAHKAWAGVARPNFDGTPPSCILDYPLIL